jgi:hypothetical protein
MPKDLKRKVRKLIKQAERILMDQNLQMSLAKLDSTTTPASSQKLGSQPLEDCEMDGANKDDKSLQFSFNEWLYTVLVRPFGMYIPELVREVYLSLELEDPLIENDLDK